MIFKGSEVFKIWSLGLTPEFASLCPNVMMILKRVAECLTPRTFPDVLQTRQASG